MIAVCFGTVADISIINLMFSARGKLTCDSSATVRHSSGGFPETLCFIPETTELQTNKFK